jgi:hypothetical protein
MSAVVSLDSLLEPLSRCLDAESARRVIAWRVDSAVQSKIDALAIAWTPKSNSDGVCRPFAAQTPRGITRGERCPPS